MALCLGMSLEKQQKIKKIIVIYLCTHEKCSPWDYVTITSAVSLFKYQGHVFCITSPSVFTPVRHKLSATAKI